MPHPLWPLLVQRILRLAFARRDPVLAYLREENRVLREQLAGRRLRFTDAQRQRLARCARRLGRAGLRDLDPIVTPDTLLRWYRRLIAQKYDFAHRRGPGRPRKDAEVESWILTMARENPRWGYHRIQGALRNLGHAVGRSTVRRILGHHGLDPAPIRGRRMTWARFLQTYWGSVAATDFFAVEVLTRWGLLRFLVLFCIDLKTRRVEIAGIRRDPDGVWMQQMARNLTDAFSGFLHSSRLLLHDRDPLFTEGFRRTLRQSGVEPLRLPPQSPNLNAHAERFVRSIRQECLSRTIPLGEAHLRKLVREYTAHYNGERNHQGIGNRLIEAPRGGLPRDGPVRVRKRLGGLLRYYYREAA